MRPLSPTVLLATALLATTIDAAAQTLYVDQGQNTGLDNGSSWADAFQGTGGLQAALAVAQPGDRIFVADGLYLASDTGDRAASFALPDAVEIYGGFLGGESSPDERPPIGSAPSVLSGDLGGNDPMGAIGDNSVHLVTTAGTTASAILDGFRITGGNASGGVGINSDRGAGILCVSGVSPTIRNCHFIGNRCTFGGAAGYINTNAAPSFTDTIFENGDGGSFGGAFDIAGGGAVLFERCVFRNNRAARAGALEIFSTNGVRVRNSVFVDNIATGNGGGGAIWAGSGGNPRFFGCTVVGNRATGQATGGIRSQGSTVTVAGSIVYDNEGQSGAQGSANQISSGLNVTYSIVEGGYAGNGNLSTDPGFVDVNAGDLRLAPGSPAIDAGNSGLFGAASPSDVAGLPREVDDPSTVDTGIGGAPIADIGAHEYQPPAFTPIAGCFGNTADLSTPSTGLVTGQAMDLSFATSTITDGVALFYAGVPNVDASGCGLPLGAFGEIFLGLAPFPVTLASLPLTGGSAALNFAVPSDASLVGIQFGFQTLGAGSSGTFEASNALLATFE